MPRNKTRNRTLGQWKPLCVRQPSSLRFSTLLHLPHFCFYFFFFLIFCHLLVEVSHSMSAMSVAVSVQGGGFGDSEGHESRIGGATRPPSASRLRPDRSRARLATTHHTSRWRRTALRQLQSATNQRPRTGNYTPVKMLEHFLLGDSLHFNSPRFNELLIFIISFFLFV